MRNQNISTEIVGDLTNNVSKNQEVPDEANANNEEKFRGSPYAVATLDGTIMLVQNEIILW